MRLRASHWTKKNPRERFWERVEKTTTCWWWRGVQTSKGYGRVAIAGQLWRVNRLAWTYEHGTIPKGSMVCHKCNNRLCVRPSHLYLGNAKSNAHDAIRAGTFNDNHQQIGIPHPKKLVWYEVQQIRRLRKQGMARKELAQVFLVGEKTIQAITNYHTWKCPPR